MMRQSLALAALVCVGCTSSATVPTPIPDVPRPGVATRIELNGAPGIAAEGGKATVVARVLDGYGKPVNGTLTFTTSSGTIDPSEAATAGGTAQATVIAAPGSVRVTARMGDLFGETLVAIQPRVDQTPPIPQPPTPLPPQPDPAPLPLSVRVSASSVVVGTPTELSAVAVNGRPPTVFRWSFGDGATATTDGGAATHLYAAAGSYPVNVTATDALGRTASGSVIASVAASTGPAPNTLTGSVNCVPATHGSETACTIIGLKYGDLVMPGSAISMAFWDFGDGTTATTHFTVAASRRYALAGTYPVIVEVDVSTADGIKKGRFVSSVIVP